MDDDSSIKSVLVDILGALDDVEVAQIRAMISLANKSRINPDWESVGRSIVANHLKALRSEAGEAAADAFIRGVMIAAGN